MKVVIQRVTHASVTIDNSVHGAIGNGLLIFLGIARDDTMEDVEWLVQKIVNLRIFDDENGVMNRSVRDTGGEVLAISQFTLMAQTKKGNRPSYIQAADHQLAIPLYTNFCSALGVALNKPIETGIFGANMQVDLLNDGPVTLLIDSKSKE